MTKKVESINCVELSRKLRRKTSEELSKMTREERIRFLNAIIDNDPLLKKVPSMRTPSDSIIAAGSGDR